MKNASRRRNKTGVLMLDDVSVDSTSPVNPLHDHNDNVISKNFLQNQRPYRHRWIKLTVVLCILHSFRTLILFTLNSDDLPRNDEFLDKPSTMLRPKRENVFVMEQSKERRRKRTRPQPFARESTMLSFLSQVSIVDHSRNLEGAELDQTNNEFEAVNHIVRDKICGEDTEFRYGPSDSIIIAGILSHPVAAEVTLTLAERCGVHRILGLSSHLLNAEESSRLEFLMHRIPSLTLRVGNGPLGDQATEDLFRKYSPTHVFYFDPSSFKATDPMNDDEEHHFKTYSGTDQLEQICNTMVKQQSLVTFPLALRTSLVYVRSSSPESNSDDLGKTLSDMTLSKFKRILLDTYRTKYNLDVIELDLPHIYGPFHGGTTWMFSEAFVQNAEEYSNDKADERELSYQPTNSQKWSMSQPLISITDALESVLTTGLQGHINNERSSSTLTVAKSQTTTALELSKVLRNLTMAEVDKGLLPLIAWNYKAHKPYRDPTSFDMSPIETNRILSLALQNSIRHLKENNTADQAVISQVERRQNDVFPCLSACASHVGCTPSVWDKISSTSRRVTEGCEFLVYTADFSVSLETLPIMKESTNSAPWPKESICQLAFVSSRSKIVDDTIQKKTRQDDGLASINKLNGMVSSNGWKLVWIDETEASMSESDYILPKIVPESVLNQNVQSVFYIEPKSFEILPPLQIMWFLMSRQLNASSRTKREKREVNKEWLLPEQHITLFVHGYNKTLTDHFDKKTPHFMANAGKIVLEQSGELTNLSQEAINRVQKLRSSRQLEAYEYSLRWQKEEHLKFEFVDTALVIFPIQNFRGKQLRCEWFEEHIFWANGDNRGLEGLSLSYVLHRMRRAGKLYRSTNVNDKWGEMIMIGDDGKLLQPSSVVFKMLVDKGDQRTDLSTTFDPQHFVKVHEPLSVRKNFKPYIVDGRGSL